MLIELKKDFFNTEERLFLKSGNIEAYLFRYPSGVEAIKIKNSKGFITVLPFRGQQVWDAVFEDRSLKMKTFFKYPKDVSSFIYTYGCFFMHCGALGVGYPGPGDTHQLHGELPYAEYCRSGLEMGEDSNGIYIKVVGDYEHQQAFNIDYTARSGISLYEEGTILEISIGIRNMSKYPMEFSYLAHINFRPTDGGKIIQPVPWNKDAMRLVENDSFKEIDDYRDIIRKIKDDFEYTSLMRSSDLYNPEVIFFLDNIKTDDSGYVHFLQEHPDGTSDYVSFNKDELDHAARWIAKNKNVEALGLAIPATCEIEGFQKEREKGNIKVINSGKEYFTTIKTGYLDKEKTKEIKDLI